MQNLFEPQLPKQKHTEIKGIPQMLLGICEKDKYENKRKKERYLSWKCVHVRCVNEKERQRGMVFFNVTGMGWPESQTWVTEETQRDRERRPHSRTSERLSKEDLCEGGAHSPHLTLSRSFAPVKSFFEIFSLLYVLFFSFSISHFPKTQERESKKPKTKTRAATIGTIQKAVTILFSLLPPPTQTPSQSDSRTSATHWLTAPTRTQVVNGFYDVT